LVEDSYGADHLDLVLARDKRETSDVMAWDLPDVSVRRPQRDTDALDIKQSRLIHYYAWKLNAKILGVWSQIFK